MSSRAPTNAPTSPAPEASPDHDTHTDADGEDDEEVIHDEFHEAFTLLDGIHALVAANYINQSPVITCGEVAFLASID